MLDEKRGPPHMCTTPIKFIKEDKIQKPHFEKKQLDHFTILVHSVGFGIQLELL